MDGDLAEFKSEWRYDGRARQLEPQGSAAGLADFEWESGMHVFKDANGKSWNIIIDVAGVKRVRGMVQVDLFSLIEDGAKGLGKLLGDPVQLVDVLFVLCKDQADKDHISDEDFGRAFCGDSLEAAGNAFMEELIDFFPKERSRTTLRSLMEKSRQVQELVIQDAEDRLAKVDIHSEARKYIERFGGQPASSESTPGPSPSAS